MSRALARAVLLVVMASLCGVAPAQTVTDPELEDVTLRVGSRRLLATSYRIGHVVISDDSICRGSFTVRQSSLEVACERPGQTTFTVYDVAEQARDHFTAHSLGSEAWVLFEELRARLADIEGVSIGVDAPYVVIEGTLLSVADVERADREAGRSDWVINRSTMDPFAMVVLYGPRARFRATYEMVDEYDFRAWHTHKHLHGLIRVEDIVVMAVRTEGGFRDIEARSRHIVGRLNHALLTIAQGMSGSFHGVADGGKAMLVFEHGGGDRIEIASVERGDVIGYSRRTLGLQPGDRTDQEVTPYMIVDWWARLVGDAADLYVAQRPPLRAAQTAAGGLLSELYERTLARSDGHYSPLLLKEIIAQTHPDERNLMEAFGVRVPVDYLTR